MMPAPGLVSFDPDFASPADWAAMYQGCGLQVVPGCFPMRGKNDKRPSLDGWKEFQTKPIPFDVFYGPEGRFAKVPNMGIIAGSISDNVFVVDLDDHVKPSAAEWWTALLAINNYSDELWTWQQRTGGGGRQLFFRAPSHWRPPTNRTSIGVDIRGEGGFALVPPTQHFSGKSYEWLPGKAPHEIDCLTAPPWLLDAIDLLVEEHGGHQGAERTADPATQYDAFGNLVDGRETYMRDVVWAAIIDLYRECPFAPGPENYPAPMLAAYETYERKVGSRLTGSDKTALLEREGRGLTAFAHKWRRALKQWDGRIKEEAAKERPTEAPEQARTEERAKEAEGIEATPFPWTDPSTIPPRRWVYGRHYIRDFLSTTVAPGGVGKSSLEIVELMAIASGKPLLQVEPHERCAVWYWNGEDPMEELLRRVMAAAVHFVMNQADLAGRFFVNTGRTTPIVVAEKTRDGVVINAPVVDQVIATIRKNKIGVMSIDPFVACHRVTENDNSEIERVAKTWAHIADVTGCAIELVHHVRKTNGAEVSVEDGRGAVALLAAARAARAINRMSSEEAQRAGVSDPQFYFRTDNGKANLAPASAAEWFRLVSIDLDNATEKNGEEPARPSDKIGVVEAWSWPDHTADVTTTDMEMTRAKVGSGNYRLDPQSPDWAGLAIIQVLGIEDTEAGRAKAKSLLDMWLKTGALRVSREPDSRRKMKDFVRVGSFKD